MMNGLAIDWFVKRDGTLYCPVCSTEDKNRGCVPANFNLAIEASCACCDLTVGESEGIVALREENMP